MPQEFAIRRRQEMDEGTLLDFCWLKYLFGFDKERVLQSAIASKHSEGADIVKTRNTFHHGTQRLWFYLGVSDLGCLWQEVDVSAASICSLRTALRPPTHTYALSFLSFLTCCVPEALQKWLAQVQSLHMIDLLIFKTYSHPSLRLLALSVL